MIASTTMRTEVTIIGGGPAGLAAALGLQQRGKDCIVIDTRQPPIDKACGEGLMPDALSSLKQLGVTITPAMGARFRGIRFLDGHHQVESVFPDGVGLGVRRTALHKVLVEHAQRCGVKIFWGSKGTYINDRTVMLEDRRGGVREIETDWIVGADGQTSRVRHAAGLDNVKKLLTRYGFRQHYQITPWTDFVEVHWSKCGQIYITPVGREEIGIALCTSDMHLRLEDALEHFPAVQSRLKNAALLSTERGSITTTRKLRRVSRNRVALIGDASGSVDAVTGEGMAISFRQAVALADAIESSDLDLYEKAHNRIGRLPTSMASALLILDRYPAIRKKALAVLSGSPSSFSRLLSVHVGHEPLWQFALTEAPHLSWRWLMA